MSSWFGSAASAVISKIASPDKYYFLTQDSWQKGIFKIYTAETVSVINKEIHTLPAPGTTVTAIPRKFIDELNLAKDFMVKVKIVSTDGNFHTFSNIPLGDLLTADTLKYPEHLTMAFLSGGEPAIDLGDSLQILSCNARVAKFTDPNVLEKLTKALNEVVANLTPVHGSSFYLESSDKKEVEIKDNGAKPCVTITLSADAKARFTSKHVGTFTLPEAPKKVEENSTAK